MNENALLLDMWFVAPLKALFVLLVVLQ